MTRAREVIVVGGGLIGSLVAFTLRQAGADVLVLDVDRPGAAWRAAAGLLTPDGERLCGTPLHADALEGLRRWPALAAQLERSGVPVHLRPGVARVLPGGGLTGTPGEGSLHPPSVVRAARQGLEVVAAQVQALGPSGGGVRVRTDTGDWFAGQVILAAGAWSGAFGVPVGAQQGQALLLRGAPGVGAWYGPPARGFSRYALSRPDGLYVGATSRDTWATTPDAHAARWLRGAARTLVPGADGAEVAAHLVGLRPVTPDGLPLVGLHPTLPGVLVAAGHGRHGALLAPVTAARVLALAERGVSA
ncbi:NAD(P)/FAD-dependent oxidoreductase [Deinococcus soli (ex Cha et al. 2016)]|uniref:NAD(P)/FAD-dependent oxidoreductase n=1 Tax=Deinococcus soli (ex Cha et al. 2016) TaxID=1309411 RepID=UPI00166DE594|nr:FAD-dependent oxidoreductase [Deinococcus soli (ex Cha et al. 2016)]GGB75092.1 glycine oxidase ThiO [Deinococcus soli (ex Cha et al. 2016)]